MKVVLNKLCRYILFTCLIPSSMFVVFNFNHNYCGKHNVSADGVLESNDVDVHEVTA